MKEEWGGKGGEKGRDRRRGEGLEEGRGGRGGTGRRGEGKGGRRGKEWEEERGVRRGRRRWRGEEGREGEGERGSVDRGEGVVRKRSAGGGGWRWEGSPERERGESRKGNHQGEEVSGGHPGWEVVRDLVTGVSSLWGGRALACSLPTTTWAPGLTGRPGFGFRLCDVWGSRKRGKIMFRRVIIHRKNRIELRLLKNRLWTGSCTEKGPTFLGGESPRRKWGAWDHGYSKATSVRERDDQKTDT